MKFNLLLLIFAGFLTIPALAQPGSTAATNNHGTGDYSFYNPCSIKQPAGVQSILNLFGFHHYGPTTDRILQAQASHSPAHKGSGVLPEELLTGYSLYFSDNMDDTQRYVYLGSHKSYVTTDLNTYYSGFSTGNPLRPATLGLERNYLQYDTAYGYTAGGSGYYTSFVQYKVYDASDNLLLVNNRFYDDTSATTGSQTRQELTWNTANYITTLIELVDTSSALAGMFQVNNFQGYKYDATDTLRIKDSLADPVLLFGVARDLYTYNSAGLLEIGLTQTFDGSSWNNFARDSYSYDGLDRLVSDLSQNWSGSSWNNHFLDSFFYTGSLPLYISNPKYIWNASNWMNYFKVDRNLNSMDEYDTSYAYIGNGASWDMYAMETYDWTALQHLTHDNIYMWDAAEAQFSDIADGNQNFYYTPAPTSIAQTKTTELRVYPNPAINKVIIPVSAPQSTISIYNTMGQLVLSQGGNNAGNISIDVDMLAPGLYTVSVQNTTETGSGKFVKQ